tara:strand:+ start:4897 stop:5160 length:264 start_codon:yes stop_codon:yes gene_type:complete
MFFKSRGVYISKPFSIYWKKSWTFQMVHMEGGIYIEAKGLGVSLRAPFMPNDNPLIAADSLILREEKNRKSLYNSWKLKKVTKAFKD